MTCCISAAKPKMLVDSQVSILTTSYFHLQRSGSSLVVFFSSGKAPYRLNGILLELKREGGEKERKSRMIYLVEKAQFSGGITEGSSADLHQLKTGSILRLRSTALPRQLWPGWSRLHSVLSFQSTRAVSRAFLCGKDSDSPAMMWIQGFPRALGGGETGSSLLTLIPVMDSNPTARESRGGRDI